MLSREVIAIKSVKVIRKWIVWFILVNVQGLVIRRPISAKPRLNFNSGFFFFWSKAFSRIILSILLRTSNHQIITKFIKLNLIFKLSYLNSNFLLTLGYLNPALNIPAQITLKLSCFYWNFSLWFCRIVPHRWMFEIARKRPVTLEHRWVD